MRSITFFVAVETEALNTDVVARITKMCGFLGISLICPGHGRYPFLNIRKRCRN
jgi:hypothetical protein